ncbi:DUF881 domain-containing protein [Rarobacter faecitabidus]|uniref:Uncharacterized protein YlxW (UPF0749 family) n=1 Tax=Rarobacter faecitabidus TaxID=13243 RepID=A0A542ZPI7_RARFA|nr:DUF881 domain-containing protein [Rarobacter faecitabidus]TQL62176.1 uncharacterized protein YlxW (UPF0749 family) [Rarobacter faecitabidus]
MTPVARRSARARRAGVIAAVVLALSGLLFTVSAQLARTSGTARHPENLLQLVRQRSDQVASLTDSVAALQNKVDGLSAQAGSGGGDGATNAAARVSAGGTRVTGPGVTVTLTDAGTDIIPPGAVADDLVVHQQDLQAVMNALWRGGAEAMTLQGVRVTARSAVRCVGNVLYLQGQIYSPPYEIAAVGSADSLTAALADDPAIEIYQQYVAAYGLGWNVAASDALDLPAASVSAKPQFAIPLGDESSVDAFAGSSPKLKTESPDGADNPSDQDESPKSPGRTASPGMS